MKIYLFRHGLAMDRDEAMSKKIPDELRSLTDKGRRKTRRAAEQFLKKSMDCLVYSPYLRAQQTALILDEQIEFKQRFESAELVPHAPVTAFCNWLRLNSGSFENIVVVGHDPHLSTLGSWLCAGGTEAFFDLKKSGVCLLETDFSHHFSPHTARMAWLSHVGR